jgi:Ca2+-binding RTX toxin-like protein
MRDSPLEQGAPRSRRQRRAELAETRRSDRRRPLAKPVHIVPLEPRIMMDAVLDFGADDVYAHHLGSSTPGEAAGTVSDLLDTAINLVEEMGAFSDLLKNELSGVLGDAGSLFSSDSDNPYLEQSNSFVDTHEHASDDTFANLKDFATEVGESLLNSVKTQVTTALNSVRDDMADDIYNYIGGKLTAYKAQLDADPDLKPYADGFSALTAGEQTQLRDAITSALNPQNFTFGDFLDSHSVFADILSRVGDLAVTLAVGADPTPEAEDPSDPTPPMPDLLTDQQISTEAAVLKAALVTDVKGAITGITSFDSEIHLNDIFAGDGTKIVEFTQGADNTKVDVTVSLAGLVPNLDSLFDTFGIDGDTFTKYSEFKAAYEAAIDLEVDFKLDLAISNDTSSLLVADPDAGTPSDDNVDERLFDKNFVLRAHNFTTDYSLGGSIGSTYLEDLKLSAGMFSAGVQSIDLASISADFGSTEFSLFFGTADADFAVAAKNYSGGAINLGSSADLANQAPGADLNFLDLVRTEAGGSDGDAATFRYASMTFFTAIDWGLVDEIQPFLPAALNISSIHIEGGFALVETAGVFDVVVTAPVAKLYDNASTPAEITQTRVTNAGGTWAPVGNLLADVNGTITALMDFDSSAFTDVFSNLASGLDALFESDIFDIELPFLDDFHLSDVLNAYQAITDQILEPLHAGLEIIGLSAGNNTAVAGVIDITGIAVDPDTGSVLDGLPAGNYTINFSVVSQTELGTDAFDATVTTPFSITLAVPANGFASMEALADAIRAKLALQTFDTNTALAAIGPVSLAAALNVSVNRGALEIRGGAHVTGFTISGTQALMDAFGVKAQNNSASNGHDLTGLQLADLTTNSWMALFELNLDLTRTVTVNGEAQTATYKTITLTPTGGAWTAVDLAAQLDEIFDDAGIYMDVTVVSAGGGQPGKLNFHVQAGALAALGTELDGVATNVSYGFAIDGANASFAASVEVMQAFATDLLDDLIPGAAFVIDVEAGALKLVLPQIEFAYETSSTQNLDFDVGALGSLDLEAVFSLAAQMSLGFTIGVDIVDYFDDNSADRSFGEYVFIEDAALDASVIASATGIHGTGRLGIIDVAVGVDPTAPGYSVSDNDGNVVEVGAALHVGLVGRDDGVYSDRLSFEQIWAEANSETGIAGMVGAFALTGAVGPGITTGKFAYLALDNIKVGISGLNIGIEANVISGLSASLADLQHPTDWEYNVNSAVADLFTSFDKGDFIDSLYNSLVLINQVMSGLVNNMAFLGEEIPVLGVSFIDALNFTEDLAAKLQAFRDDPNGGLDGIEEALRDALGLSGTSTSDSDYLVLHWDDATDVFYVSLGLGFLEGAEVSYDFTLDLMSLLGQAAAADPSGMAQALLDVVSSLANVTGEGTIILDAAADLTLTFGIDLSGVLPANSPVTAATLLTGLATVSQITFNTLKTDNDAKDLLIGLSRFNGTAQVDFNLEVELDGAKTVGEAIDKITAAIFAQGLDDEFALVVVDTLGVSHQIASDALPNSLLNTINIESIGFVDLKANTPAFYKNYAPMTELFGGTTDRVPASGKIIGSVDLTTGFDPKAAHRFALTINGSEPIVVTVGAWEQKSAIDHDNNSTTPKIVVDPLPVRDLAGFVSELQAKLAAQFVSRPDIGLGSFGDIPLDKLFQVALVGNHLELTLTNFAPTINGTTTAGVFTPGAQVSLVLTGLPNGASSVITVEDLGGANLAAALGLGATEDGIARGEAGTITGMELTANAVPGDGVSVFFATKDVVGLGVDFSGNGTVGAEDVLKASGISFTFIAGVNDGLNMTLAIGPLSVSVVDGHALISGGDLAHPSTPAFVKIGFNDAADDANTTGADETDGRLGIDSIVAAFLPGSAVTVADLFTLDAKAYLDIALPIEDSLGLLNPDDHHINIRGTLLDISGGTVVGILPALVSGGSFGSYLTLDVELVPDFAGILADLNPYAILNDPLLLTSGLDTILTAIDKTLRKIINAMDLPIVGDSMMQGLNLFNDVKNAILQPILAAASTPKANGDLPTTIDLLEGVVNDVLKDLFGTDQDIISAYLVENQDNPVLYAEIAFDVTVFSAALDVGFDLGIPGFNLDVGAASAILFDIVADLHIGFGIDRNGFFFLNDTDEGEISLTAVISTAQGFTAAATLGVVGLAISTNKIDGEDYYGAMLKGVIAIDLFTTLGEASDYQEDTTDGEDDFVTKYEKVVRLDDLSSSKSASGQGTKVVALTGEFELHVNFAIETGITNPVTGAPITALPSAFADFVIDASYAIGGELDFERMEFQNLGLYAGDFLVDNVLPVLDQVATYIKPIADAVSFLKTTSIGPLSLYDIIKQAITAVGGPAAQSALFIFDAADTIADIIDYIDTIKNNNGIIYFGTFSLLSASSSTGVVDVSDTRAVSNVKAKPTVGVSSNFQLNAAMQNRGPGLEFDFKIFDDVSNVLNLITGNLAEVDLFEIHATLLDFTLNIDLKNTIKSAISFIPGEVLDALLGGMNAKFYVHAEAGMTIGYDLYGIANFLQSGDATDIIDGIYFDSDQPLLALEASFMARVGVNFWIIQAGLELGGYFGVSIDLNDPNDDGKMRMSELAYIFKDGVSGLAHVMEGDVKGGIYMSVYYSIDLFFFSISDSFELFSYDFTAHFGYDFPPEYAAVVGGVATFNIGANAGSLVGGSPEDAIDGDDEITFSLVSGHYIAHINGHDIDLTAKNATKLVIFAGEGDNFIDFTGLSASFTVQFVSGGGDDVVFVGSVGGIISTGDGDDRVYYTEPPNFVMMSMMFVPPYGGSSGGGGGTTASPTSGQNATTASAYSIMTAAAAASGAGGVPTTGNGAGVPKTNSQQLLIDLGTGADTLDMSGSSQNIVVISGGGGGMEITIPDTTVGEFKRVLLADWLLQPLSGGALPTVADALAKIEPELARYTALWQTEGDDTGDTITLGSGNDIVFAGNGDDVIDVGGGNDQVYAGGGNDRVEAGTGNDWVEGGAGADIIIGDTGNDVLLGWGRYDETTTTADFLALGAVRPDILLQTDLTALNAANQTALGTAIDKYLKFGLYDATTRPDGVTAADISTIGTFTQTNLVNIAKAFSDFVKLVEGMQVDDTSDWIEGNDGDDIIHGGTDSDILQGSAGDDLIFGGSATDIIAGGGVTVTHFDGAVGTILSQTVDLTGIYTVKTVTPSADGNDHLLGQGGSDVLLGGAGNDKLEGGDFFNVLIGDFASLKMSGQSLLEVNPTNIDNALQGDDLLIGGSVADVIMGNGGKDVLNGGMGENILIGDNANLEGNNLFKGVETMVSLKDARDDADTIFTGLTQSLIVAGAGGTDGDTIVTGLLYGGGAAPAERMIIFADYGDLSGPQASIGTLTTTFEEGDADTVTTTNGDDIIFGGVGADTISSGAGNDIVFGDTGTYRTAPVSDTRRGFTVSSEHDVLDNPGNGSASEQTIVGADMILGGDGNNIVIAGGGADEITTGIGLDVIIGDLGNVRVYGKDGDGKTDLGVSDGTAVAPDLVATGSQPGVLVLNGLPQGGAWDDIIITGLGDDVAIGGDGSDRIAGGDDDSPDPTLDMGRLIALGDFGSVGVGIIDASGHRVVHDVESGEPDTNTVNDPTGPMAKFIVMTAAVAEAGAGKADGLFGGADEDMLVGGDGNDEIYGYGGADLLFGDHVRINSDPVSGVTTAEGFLTAFPGNDFIYGGAGRDVIVAGDGDDYMEGNEGQDLIAGDEAAYTNYGNGYELFESRFPFEGGDDIIKGGPGNDMVISGYFNFGKPGAGDLIYGDTIEDFLMAGAGSLYIHGHLVERVNYLGLAPFDNISNRQITASAGVQLRPNYERGINGEEARPSPFELIDRSEENQLVFEPEAPSQAPAAVFATLDALLSERVLSDDILRLIELYRQGAISLADLDGELREALVSALFDAYGYRLPEPVVNMLDRYLALLYDKLEIDAETLDDASADAAHAAFGERFAAAFNAA